MRLDLKTARHNCMNEMENEASGPTYQLPKRSIDAGQRDDSSIASIFRIPSSFQEDSAIEKSPSNYDEYLLPPGHLLIDGMPQ